MQVEKRPLGICSPKSRRRSKNLIKAGEGPASSFSFHYSPRCPRSTGQTSTQPTRGANTSTYDAEGQAQPAAVTQPSYFDPNSHSSLSTPLVAHQSSPAAAPVLKGYDLSPSRSPSKWYTLRYLDGLRITYFLAYSSSRYAWTTAGDEQPGASFINWSW